MVLFSGVSSGPYKAYMHSERTRSSTSLCNTKGYKLNAGVIIENSIMKYHEGNKRGIIPHLATITWLCLKVGVKGTWAE